MDELIWEKWRKARDPQAGEYLVSKYLPLVDYIVRRIAKQLPVSINREDLLSYGYDGLLDAMDKFDLGRKLKFETYASLRIRGAIIDALRKNDWVPRSLRDKIRKIEEAYEFLEQEWKRSVSPEEVSAYLGVEVGELHKLMGEGSQAQMLFMDEVLIDEEEQQINRYSIIEDPKTKTPDHLLDETVIKETLMEAIKALPEKEKIVVSLFYYDELTFTEIAQILGVSPARISQLHAKAIQRLKKSLGPWMELGRGVGLEVKA